MAGSGTVAVEVVAVQPAALLLLDMQPCGLASPNAGATEINAVANANETIILFKVFSSGVRVGIASVGRNTHFHRRWLAR
jgi:hypothetical protein